MYVRVIIGTTSYCNQAYLIALLLCSSGDNVAAGPSWRWFIVAMLMLPVSERVSLGDYWYAVPPSKLPMLVQHSIFYLSALIIPARLWWVVFSLLLWDNITRASIWQYFSALVRLLRSTIPVVSNQGILRNQFSWTSCAQLTLPNVSQLVSWYLKSAIGARS